MMPTAEDYEYCPGRLNAQGPCAGTLDIAETLPADLVVWVCEAHAAWYEERLRAADAAAYARRQE